REAPGAGLGLALVRRLAESMGGSVEVGDTPGGGATFRVHLQIGV
ncbi:MAG: ATP-binding protein, partial [Planctomycetota bacterium]